MKGHFTRRAYRGTSVLMHRQGSGAALHPCIAHMPSWRAGQFGVSGASAPISVALNTPPGAGNLAPDLLLSQSPTLRSPGLNVPLFCRFRDVQGKDDFRRAACIWTSLTFMCFVPSTRAVTAWEEQRKLLKYELGQRCVRAYLPVYDMPYLRIVPRAKGACRPTGVRPTHRTSVCCMQWGQPRQVCACSCMECGRRP